MNNKMELTKEMLETLDFRRTRLCGKLQRLESLTLGQEASLLPAVRNGNGSYDEEKTWRLADELADAMERWGVAEEDAPEDSGQEAAFQRELRLRGGSDGPEEDSRYQRFLRWYRQAASLQPRTHAQKEARHAFYHSFFYCALRVAESDPFWLWKTKGCYGDLLHLARELHYTEAAELHFQELCGRKGPVGTFALMDALYAELSGRHIAQTISRKERELAQSLHPEQAVLVERLRSYMDTVWEPEAGWEDDEDEEGQQAAEAYYASLSTEDWARIDEGFQEFLRNAAEVPVDPAWEEGLEFMSDGEDQQSSQDAYDALPEEDKRRMAEESQWYIETELRRQAWLEKFPERDRFCQEYLNWRKLYFSLEDRQNVPQEVERMLAAYLCAQNASAVLDDDRFFSAYVLADKAAAQVRRTPGEPA